MNKKLMKEELIRIFQSINCDIDSAFINVGGESFTFKNNLINKGSFGKRLITADYIIGRINGKGARDKRVAEITENRQVDADRLILVLNKLKLKVTHCGIAYFSTKNVWAIDTITRLSYLVVLQNFKNMFCIAKAHQYQSKGVDWWTISGDHGSWKLPSNTMLDLGNYPNVAKKLSNPNFLK